MAETQRLGKADRESMLNRMMISESGRAEIMRLYKRIRQIPEGTTLPPGTLYGQDMIPAIIASEYPE